MSNPLKMKPDTDKRLETKTGKVEGIITITGDVTLPGASGRRKN